MSKIRAKSIFPLVPLLGRYLWEVALKVLCFVTQCLQAICMSSSHLVLSRVFFLRANYRKYKKMINSTDLVTGPVALCTREDSKKIIQKVNSKHGDMKDYFPSL